jgi:hypothetical protein
LAVMCRGPSGAPTHQRTCSSNELAYNLTCLPAALRQPMFGRRL